MLFQVTQYGKQNEQIKIAIRVVLTSISLYSGDDFRPIKPTPTEPSQNIDISTYFMKVKNEEVALF